MARKLNVLAIRGIKADFQGNIYGLSCQIGKSEEIVIAGDL
ncbi:hypothetical protein [Bacteroidetes bacterium endosymbiont of Geopemphigus sp.]|nr:hypothetical protein [Bacteroidetes bacterium endosymbiont of Geopemphigus sp.]